MNIYLAACYSRRLELCGYREQLEALGHVVTSRWLNGKHQISDSGKPIGDQGEALVESDDNSSSNCAAALREIFACEDVNDVRDASMIVNFTEVPRSEKNRGGRHVEMGIAIEKRMRLIVVGHRENIFHWLPDVEFYATWEQCLTALEAEQQRAA